MTNVRRPLPWRGSTARTRLLGLGLVATIGLIITASADGTPPGSALGAGHGPSPSAAASLDREPAVAARLAQEREAQQRAESVAPPSDAPGAAPSAGSSASSTPTAKSAAGSSAGSTVGTAGKVTSGSTSGLSASAAPANPAVTATGCAARPSACGYPDASNTGVSAGVALRAVPAKVTSGAGWHWDGSRVTIDGAGTVFEGFSVSGPVEVGANGVTVRNVAVAEDGNSVGIKLLHTATTRIENCEITSPVGKVRLEAGIKDVYGDATGTTILSCDISRTSTGIQTHEGLIQGNYIHDMGLQAGDHLNGTASNGATTPLTIQHNTILNNYGQTDAISLFEDFGQEGNRVIDDNLLAGGGYTIYGGQNPGKATAFNIKITHNRISRIYFPDGGSYGPVTAFDPSGPNNVWSANIWDDTGAAIPTPSP